MDQLNQLTVFIADLSQAVFERDQPALVVGVGLDRRLTQQLLAYQFTQVAAVAILPPVVLHQLAAGDGQQPGAWAGAGTILLALPYSVNSVPRAVGECAQP